MADRRPRYVPVRKRDTRTAKQQSTLQYDPLIITIEAQSERRVRERSSSVKEAKSHFPIHRFKRRCLGMVQEKYWAANSHWWSFDSRICDESCREARLRWLKSLERGWLTRFKERHNLSQQKVCGESADWCTSSYSFLVERGKSALVQ